MESSQDQSEKNKYINYSIITVVCILIIIIIATYLYNNSVVGMFQGAFPFRSDVGSDKFDLQKEVNYLLLKQKKNLLEGYKN